jgi:DNA repair exonuclease SbcCD ATPase subunit
MDTIAAHERQERQHDAQRQQRLEESFGEKLSEAQGRLGALKQHYDRLSTELEQARGEAAEFQAKCTELARQKRKLEELYENVKAQGNSSPRFGQSPPPPLSQPFPPRGTSPRRFPALPPPISQQQQQQQQQQQRQVFSFFFSIFNSISPTFLYKSK